MKTRYYLIVIILVSLLGTGIFYQYSSIRESRLKRDVLFQSSGINFLLEGGYDGEITFKDLKKHGDFGIGTFNGLDGEMVGVDGDFYQIKVDGFAYPVDDSTQTPFAVVTFFEPDETFSLPRLLNYTQLQDCLDELLPSKNIFYAVKIDGVFDYIKARSVPRQEKPYQQFSKVIENQSIFEFYRIEGTMIGFWTPEHIGEINVPGYHFHFISKDKSTGGHVLDCLLHNVTVELDLTSEFLIVLSGNDEFYEDKLIVHSSALIFWKIFIHIFHVSLPV